MKKHAWNIKEISESARHAARQHSISLFISQVLLNRGVRQEEFDKFLKPGRDDFHSPFLLPDIEPAAERIKRAAFAGEKVLVFGDYDVDGITSLAIFNEYAKHFPGVFSFYIPHRVDEGYGLNNAAITRAKEENISLIITFDCGSSAVEPIDLANSLGIDVVVIDHHHVPQAEIKALAFVNPKRSSSVYPFADLSAAALAYKVLQVLTGQPEYGSLDLVALSLVCDVMPLCGENRALLKEGLDVLRRSQRPAIKALCDVAGIKQAAIDTFHIGYILGPRINASGRVAHANDSLKLFFSDDLTEAVALARTLSDHNKLRKNIETQILKEAEQKLREAQGENTTIVVAGQEWHPGVLGIVASRLADKYGKPSFVISFDRSGQGVGSARSVEGVHLIEMLDGCAGTLKSYGGHRKAAGVHIQEEELENFKEKINALIEENISPEPFDPVIDIDARLSFKDIDASLVYALEDLKPHGEANPKPLFAAQAVYKKSRPKKINFGYSVWLSDGIVTIEGIFYKKELMDVFSDTETMDIAFSLQMNTYHNIPRLAIRDCRLSESSS